MKCRMPVILEPIVLRGIEGFIADEYLHAIAKGNLDVGILEDYQEAPNMAIQMYMQWKGVGLK